MQWRVRETTAFVCSGATRVVAVDLTDASKPPLAFEGPGACIWNSLLGSGAQRVTRSDTEVVANVATQFNLAVDQVKDDVSVFLGELESAGLIEQSASVGGANRGSLRWMCHGKGYETVRRGPPWMLVPSVTSRESRSPTRWLTPSEYRTESASWRSRVW
ncbi:PqqD family protein [Tessaracoccus defluvii]|uniref:PqqD family protein n=1 Tax=Tessaracoccus defluvii TaxID=1285901 RepID=UPI00387344DF